MPKASRKRRRFSNAFAKVRSWPALVLAISLLLAGGVLWQVLSRQTLSQDLLAKLPSDSRIAGVARISEFDYASLEQVSTSSRVYGTQTKAVVEAVRGSASPELIHQALTDEVAFAEKKGNLLAVFTVRNGESFSQLANVLQGKLSNGRTVTADSATSGRISLYTGQLPGLKRPLFIYHEGRSVFVSTDPGLVLDARISNQGFQAKPGFAEVSKSLPGGADAYVFLNGTLSEPYPRLSFSLAGLAVRNERDQLEVEMVSSESPQTVATMRRGSGDLLLPASTATFSVAGRNAGSLLKVLEEQRGDSDLPKVIRLQNGLASLDRRLGVDLEADYLAAASGQFVYGRYTDKKTRQWMTALEFESPEVAQTRIASLEQVLRARLRVPVRREVVKVLPDGTRSREIESEKDEALSIKDVTVLGQPAKRTKLPSLGNVVWQVHGRYVVAGSSEQSVERLVQSIDAPQRSQAKGQLVVRVDLSRAKSLAGGEDVLFDWLLAVRAERGNFTIDKQTGVLAGGLTLAER